MHSSPHSSTPIRYYSHSGRVPRSFSSRAPSSCVSWILSQFIIPPVYLLAHSVTMPYRDDGCVKQGNGLCFSLKFWSRIHWPILCFVVVFVTLWSRRANERTNEWRNRKWKQIGAGLCINIRPVEHLYSIKRLQPKMPTADPRLEFPSFLPSIISPLFCVCLWLLFRR